METSNASKWKISDKMAKKNKQQKPSMDEDVDRWK